MNASLSQTLKRISMLTASVLLFVQAALPMVALADGNGSTDECKDQTTNVIGGVEGTANTITKDVGAGKVATGVCIKSGDNMFGETKHSTALVNGTYSGLSEDGGSEEPACYTVTGVGTQTVTVQRVTESDTCQGLSHIDVIYDIVTNYCDPSQKPGGVSIDNWVPKDVHCVTPSVVPACGELTGSIDSDITADWGDDYEIVWSEGAADYTKFVPLPGTFDEDYNGGSVTVYYWIVGPEAGYVQGHGFPNYWDQNAASVVIDTDCAEDTTGSISGYKWNDEDGSGNTNGGTEDKLPNWKIFLDENENYLWDEGELFELTDENGEYEFTGLALGSYTICEVQQAGWTQTYPDTQTDCSTTTLTEESHTRTGKNFGNMQIPEVDYCDPSQRPAGQSIAQWLAANQIDGSECFDYEVSKVCSSLDVQFTKNLTPYNYSFRYVIGSSTPELANWQGSGVLPVNFSEDQNGGSVTVTYYVVGEEKDYFTGFGIPNIWDGNGVTVNVDTDCKEPETGSVSGFKFNDADNSASYTEGEEKLSGWTIKLYNVCETVELPAIFLNLNREYVEEVPECEEAEIDSTTTDTEGNYSFNDLNLGAYKVCEVNQDGWEQTYPTSEDGCHEISIESSGQVVTANFGNKAKTPGRVLGDTPQVLADTGTPMGQGIMVGMSILGAAAGVTSLTRRKER